MSTEPDSVNADRLNSIERRLKERVERKWTPLREKHDKEPMEIQRKKDGVVVGHTNARIPLRDDVIRTFDTRHYDFRPRNTDRGREILVRPISKSDFYEIPYGMDVDKAAALRALKETNIHVPMVNDCSGGAWLRHFETKEEAEKAAEVLEPHIETAYNEMWNEGVGEIEIREFEERREWLAPDSWYSVLVHYE